MSLYTGNREITSGVEEYFERSNPVDWGLLQAALVAWELRNGYTPIPSVWEKRGDKLRLEAHEKIGTEIKVEEEENYCEEEEEL